MDLHIENEVLNAPEQSSLSVCPGNPYPLGATWDGKDVNFAVFSENAEAVERCLFTDESNESVKIKIEEVTHGAGMFTSQTSSQASCMGTGFLFRTSR